MAFSLRVHPLTIRAALVLGFGLVLGLWLVTGYSFTRRFGAVQQADAAFNDRYLRNQELLAQMRDHVLQGSADARNVLLERSTAAAAADRRHFETAAAEAVATLGEYMPVFDTDAERTRLAELHDELQSFRVRMMALLRTDGAIADRSVRELLDLDIAAPRNRMIEAIDRAQAANRAEFVQVQQGVAARYNDLQQQASRQLGIVLGVSGAIALFAIAYAGRLEGRLRRQQEKEARTADDLQHLSARLISAQEDERRAIARELHDEIGQALMAIKVEIAYAQRAVATIGGPDRLLDEAGTITDGVLRSVRDLSELLNPPLLDDMGLPAAVDWYVAGFGRRHPIEVELRSEGMHERLPADVETAAYRIIQEALTNVAKHAGAQTCRVVLRRTAGQLRITVEDDGHGFDPEALESHGARRRLGLVGMRERVARLNGRLAIDSSPDTGTRVNVELPV